MAPEASRLLRARERIRDYVTLFCASQRLIDDVVLAVEEACTNAIRHSGSSEDIDIGLAFRDHDLRIVVGDRGRGFDVDAFDPTEVPDPMLDHGRGLFLMSRLCDELEVRSDGGTIVSMTKHHVPVQAPPGREQGFSRQGAGHATGYWQHREQALLEEMAEAFATLDWEYRVSYANRAALEFFGMRLAEVVGTSFWDIFPQTMHMAVGDGVRRAMELGHSSIEEYLSPAVGRWVECRIYPASSGVSLYVRGIDERKRKELERDELLRAQRQRAALDAYRVKLGDALRELDDAAQIKATAGRILGEQLGADNVVYLEVEADGESVLIEDAYSRGPSPGMRGLQQFADHSRWLADELRAGKQVVVTDVEQLTQDPPAVRAAYGALGVRAFVACPLVKGGYLAAILAVTQTAARVWSAGEQEQVAETAERLWAAAGRARAEAARRAAEERERYLAEVIENGDVPFAVRRPTGELVLFNQAFADLVGYSREELEADAAGLAVELTPPEWWQAETPLLAQAVTERRPVRYEKEYVRRDGSRVPIEVFAQPVFAPDGMLLQYRSFLTDVTERKRAEQARVEASEQADALSRELRDSLGEQTALTERVQLELARTRLLQDVAVAASMELDLATMADKALNALRAHLQLSSGEIRRSDEGRLRLVSSFGDAGAEADVDVRRSSLLAARAVRQRRTLSQDDLTPGPETAATLAGRGATDERYVHVPLAHHGHVKGLLSLTFAGRRPFRPGELALFEAAARIIGQAMENVRLLEAEREATLLALALTRIDQVLHSSLDVDDIMARALEEGGKALSADAATVMLQHGDAFTVTYGWNVPAASFGVVVPGWRELLGSLSLRAREPIAVDDTAGDARVSHSLMDEWGIQSVIAVPLPQRSGADAVLHFNYTSARHHFSQAETAFAARLGASLAAALENARLYDQQRHIAETLQQTLMHPLPEVPGLELGTAAATAHEAELIGGDFSDVFVVGEGLVAILIGDVAGKGVHAAGLTERVRAQVRSFASIDPAPHLVLARADDLLVRAAPDDPHVTAFLALLDLATGRLVYASAGHPAPVHLAAASCDVLDADYGPPLGSFPAVYGSRETVLARGDCLVLYSDGVTEARRDRRLFGEERLVQSVADSRGGAAQQVADDLERRVRDFARRLDDDLQIVVVRLI